MIKNLRKIKKERSGYGGSFAIYYTATAINEDNEWKYKFYDPRPIYDNQLALIKKFKRVRNSTRFVFAVYDRAGDGAYKLNNKKELHVTFEHNFGAVYATLYYNKSIQEIRKEKIAFFLHADV